MVQPKSNNFYRIFQKDFHRIMSQIIGALAVYDDGGVDGFGSARKISLISKYIIVGSIPDIF
jgi:hypothetical protein